MEESISMQWSTRAERILTREGGAELRAALSDVTGRKLAEFALRCKPTDLGAMQLGVYAALLAVLRKPADDEGRALRWACHRWLTQIGYNGLAYECEVPMPQNPAQLINAEYLRYSYGEQDGSVHVQLFERDGKPFVLIVRDESSEMPCGRSSLGAVTRALEKRWPELKVGGEVRWFYEDRLEPGLSFYRLSFTVFEGRTLIEHLWAIAPDRFEDETGLRIYWRPMARQSSKMTVEAGAPT